MMIDMIEVNRLVTTYTMVFRGGRKTRKKKKKKRCVISTEKETQHDNTSVLLVRREKA